MKNPVDILGSRLAENSSRRGFLAKLGKVTLASAAVLAGLGLKEAHAGCGDCPSPCCPGGCGGDTVVYYGCCRHGPEYYVTVECLLMDGSLDCYMTYDTYTGCPNLPVGSPVTHRSAAATPS